MSESGIDVTSLPVVFGKYRLLKKVAQGGMAEIFLAKATGAGGFEKTVIVKRILPRLSAHDKFVRMFINEAKVTSVLSHSNIVQIFDFGRIGRDYFIAMEYVDGKDLRSIIRACREKNRRVPMEFVLYAGVQIAKALAYAHSRNDPDGHPLGLVHRDVSPQNVILSRQGEIKLTDFGIAKASATLGETMANEIKGNFGYMPPEQAAGSPLDPRADVYAAAMCLYELSTLRNPFADANLLVVLQRIRETPPPPPSSFNPAVSRTVDHILLKALEKNPAARFQSGAELGAALSEELFPSPTELIQVSFGAFLDSLFPPEHPTRENTPSRGFLAAKGPAPASVSAARPEVIPRSSITPLADSDIPTVKGIATLEPDDSVPTARSPATRPAAPARPATPSGVSTAPRPAAPSGSRAAPVARGPFDPANEVSKEFRAARAPAASVSSTPGAQRDDARFARKVRDLANMARLRLDVAPANVEILIDDHPVVAGAPVEIQTSAKVEHRLELRAAGFSDFSTTFVLSPGEVRDFQIVLAERPR